MPADAARWRLATGEVHVWQASLDASDEAAPERAAGLSADELVRAAGLRFDRDRLRFVNARGWLRTLLGRYLGAAPDQVRLGYGPRGKPFVVASSDQPAVSFNVAHSGGVGLFAFALGRELGIDIERAVPTPHGEEVAELFFSPREVEALRALPADARPLAFLHCWTRKEAYVKALGEGLGFPLDAFDVSLAPGQPAALLRVGRDQTSRWSLRDLTPECDGFVAALAVEGSVWRTVFSRLEGSSRPSAGRIADPASPGAVG